MLKSHFNLVIDDDEPPVEEEQQKAVDVAVPVEEEELSDTRFLTKAEISVGLSMLGKTSYGDGYTYLKATIRGLKLTHIEAIKTFQHLLFLDLSNNCLDIDALQAITELPFLVLIQADNNKLNSAALNKMKYLQVMIFNDNQITTVHDVFQEQLSTLEFGNNKIEKIAFDSRIPTLKVLDFRNNVINEITTLDFPILDSLYLAGNKLKSLVGIEKLVNLRILHVRDNPIRLLDGFDEAQTKLQYINLRSCKVSTIKQIKKLRVLKGLVTLVLKGCPYMGGRDDEKEDEDPETRTVVIAALPHLKRLNKDPVTPEEKEEAKVLMTQWLEEGEKDEEEEVVEEEEHVAEEEIRNED